MIMRLSQLRQWTYPLPTCPNIRHVQKSFLLIPCDLSFPPQLSVSRQTFICSVTRAFAFALRLRLRCVCVHQFAFSRILYEKNHTIYTILVSLLSLSLIRDSSMLLDISVALSFYCWAIFLVRIYHTLFTHSSGRHLCCSWFSSGHTLLFLLGKWIARNLMYGLYGRHILNF